MPAKAPKGKSNYTPQASASGGWFPPPPFPPFPGGKAPMSEFSGVPFVAGALYGIRAFDVSPEGTLHSPSATFDWGPDINIAICNRETGLYNRMIISRHKIASGDCTCGFYAYFQTKYDAYWIPGRARAIIKATGTITYGSRGFRCEKARIVAIAFDETVTDTPQRSKSAPPRRAPFWDLRKPPKPAKNRPLTLSEKIKLLYPNAKFFTTEAEAVKAFPLTPPSTPESDGKGVTQIFLMGGRAHGYTIDTSRAWEKSFVVIETEEEEARAFWIQTEKGKDPLSNIRIGIVRSFYSRDHFDPAMGYWVFKWTHDQQR